MSATAAGLWIRVGLSALFTPAFFYTFDALGVPIPWVIAVVLAVLLVFGGTLVIAWADDL
jgi:hypothetical protein